MLDHSSITGDTKNQPLVSVIVPVYKVEEYIKKCIDSLLCQTYQNIEIVLVDDGTPDHAGVICENYAKMDKRIVVYHKHNGGLSDARNYGIKKSKGKYITFVDSDDYVDADYISYLFYLLTKHNAKMSICQHRVHFDSGKINDHSVKKCDELVSTEKCLERMLYHDGIDTSAWAKLYHRELFEDVCFPKGKLFEDIGTVYKFMMQCDAISVGYESKYNYIVREDSIVNSAFRTTKLDLLEMTDQMAKDVVRRFPTLEKAATRRCVYARLSTLNQMANTNDYEDLRRKLITYIKTYRWEMLKNEKVPKRDKAAVLLLTIGYPVYEACWKLYLKLCK